MAALGVERKRSHRVPYGGLQRFFHPIRDDAATASQQFSAAGRLTTSRRHTYGIK